MIYALFQILSVLPILTVAGAIVGVWLLRRRPGRLRPVWLLGFGTLLVAADATELPDPPSPWGAGEAMPAHHTIEGGFGGGSYQTCSGSRRYGLGGAMYSYTTPISQQTNVVVSGGLFGGIDGTAGNGGGRASVGFEHRWIGGSIGAVGGYLHRESVLDAPILPTATLRLGPRDMVFLDASFADQSPGPIPGPIAELGAGIAFPKLGNSWEPLRIRAGLNMQGIYVAPSFPVGDIANVEVMGAYGDSATWGGSAVVRFHLDAR